jgi:hypothetical protein
VKTSSNQPGVAYPREQADREGWTVVF